MFLHIYAYEKKSQNTWIFIYVHYVLFNPNLFPSLACLCCALGNTTTLLNLGLPQSPKKKHWFTNSHDWGIRTLSSLRGFCLLTFVVANVQMYCIVERSWKVDFALFFFYSYFMLFNYVFWLLKWIVPTFFVHLCMSNSLAG